MGELSDEDAGLTGPELKREGRKKDWAEAPKTVVQV